MEELVDENCVCSEMWWSASKSSLCHELNSCNELSSCCSSQAFFSACNFLYDSSGLCGYLWAQVPCFPLVQCRKVTRAGSRSLWSRGIGLAPCYLDFVQPEFSYCVQHFCGPWVAWGDSVRKKVFWTFKAGWTPLESVKRMGSLVWKCIKGKTLKKWKWNHHLWYLWVLSVKHLLIFLVFSVHRYQQNNSHWLENQMHAKFTLMQKWNNIMAGRSTRPICQWLTANIGGW